MKEEPANDSISFQGPKDTTLLERIVTPARTSITTLNYHHKPAGDAKHVCQARLRHRGTLKVGDAHFVYSGIAAQPSCPPIGSSVELPGHWEPGLKRG